MEVRTVTPDAISKIIANPSPDFSVERPDLVVQVLDLKSVGNRFMLTASDGKQKIKGILQSSFSDMVSSGSIQNLGLIRILEYTLNDIPNKPEKYLLITKCEAVSPALEAEVKSEDSGVVLKPHQDVVKAESNSEVSGLVLKPKQEIVAKSAAQIIHEQRGNEAPAARMAMTRRVLPLASLNPYQGNWTIKVRVTSKGNLRSFRNARGEGNVFNVELTDEDGTQIQATMFNEAARMFFDKFQVGKVFYISKGFLKVANKQYKTVQNDYEMTLNENSVVEEASDEGVFIPETKFNFVPIDQLGLYVNGKEFVDVIGVVKNVSETMSIRRKINNEMIPRRNITIADESKKTVVVSLWNEHATTLGQELLDMADKSPVIAIKTVKVGDFQGVSLSAISKSIAKINPDIPESKKLKSWYESEGKEASMASVGAGMTPSNSGGRSMYTDRVSISHITSSPSLGEDKPVFFNIKACISLIKADQALWYRACKTCNKKVTEAIGSGYWCEGCQKNEAECNLRYVLNAKISDASGEAWVSTFNEQAEKLIGCSADELDKLKSQDGEENLYQMKLKEAAWVPHIFRVSVSQQEYMNEKRQRITVRAVAQLDCAAETSYLLAEIAKMKVSQ
ncbi:replication protein A 70 kDa DNA-binding subunit B [Amaranthus tricolor]|uniref:replication protein A 70 kDa DNA-binding subunit B n=1 Tax=Amaranthus tricolor TaxID=29722 RepID=UPI002589BC0E|nr:replication protein A 70 kDa DNA-binding subunit B [Amaranthus tricolor]